MPDTLQELLEDKYKKLYDLSKEDETRLEKLKVIETGALSLDTALGIGGIPRGRVTFIFGKEASGKTHLVLEVVKNAIISGLNVLYIDFEGGLDQQLVEEYFKGLDYTITGNVLHYTLTYQDHWLKVLKVESFEDGMSLCEDGIRTGEIGVCVIDSISAGSPNEELEKTLIESTMMQQSKLLAKFFRRNIFKILKNEVAAIFIGQVRASIGSYVPTQEPTGGMAIKHFSSIEIQTNPLTSEKNLIMLDKIPVGVPVVCIIKKNKLAPPYRRCTIPIMFGKGIDRFRDVVQFSETLGIISLRKSWYYFGDELLGQGFVKAMEYLKEHKETLDKIKEQVYNLVTKESNYVENSDD